MQEMKGEMQNMGLNLQAGEEAIRVIARGEMRAMGEKMAPARGGMTESGECSGCFVCDGDW